MSILIAYSTIMSGFLLALFGDMLARDSERSETPKKYDKHIGLVSGIVGLIAFIIGVFLLFKAMRS